MVAVAFAHLASLGGKMRLVRGQAQVYFLTHSETWRKLHVLFLLAANQNSTSQATEGRTG